MTVSDSNGTVTLELPNGASAEIKHFGATVISWKSAETSASKDEIKERFFLSSKSALDGSKPIRGGIPIVFPFFGGATREEHKPFSSHGFARSEKWEYAGVVSESEENVSVRFVLEPSAGVAAKYDQPFLLEYIVTLSQYQLATELHVTNPATASSPLVHQALLHNYIAASPTSTITISPLTNLTYVDKANGGVEQVESRRLVDVKSHTDSVYKSAPGTYEVRWEGEGGGGLDIKTSGFPDVVVWNPHAEVGSKIGDLEEGGWEKYVCVEPGFVSSWNTLQPGEKWVGSQTLIPL
ncbi:glucose-6-phosphate 1-epimerase [Cantharellus anzutake]|uniref:glucose-6-phosphate 1-epimerase n=1 Tax=Cantharellus anzutake TaxID=1750568 RepID=UPI001906A201|nr:glucose-6-phosphate 1-epimerase [Cantharellus anzutake]KAF8321406.1 glucose-6-phosphate 1-epimerase [Cantharellus anzutake]